MRRSSIAVVAGVAGLAMLTAMVLVPFTHLHVGVNEHNHPQDLTHDHHSLVHAHLEVHHSPDSNPETDGAGWDHHAGARVLPLDTMATEIVKTAPVAVALEVAHVLPAPDRGPGRYRLRLPRAHGPPFALPTLGRAPPV